MTSIKPKKNIIIVGASRGIGRELAKQLSVDHNVLLLSRNLVKLKELQANSSSIEVAAIDLGSEKVKESLIAIINEHFEHVDILINNAGLLINKPFGEISEQEMKDVYNVNVFGLMSTCQAVIPFMKNGGHIVNIGSMGGFQGSSKFPGLSVYSSSKAAVASFTECLAEELKDWGIQVNCLALGAVQTEMLAEAFPEYKTPMGPEKMAQFIAEFSLNTNEWMNGKVIPVSLTTP